jgi:hypothetical protein
MGRAGGGFEVGGYSEEKLAVFMKSFNRPHGARSNFILGREALSSGPVRCTTIFLRCRNPQNVIK